MGSFHVCTIKLVFAIIFLATNVVGNIREAKLCFSSIFEIFCTDTQVKYSLNGSEFIKTAFQNLTVNDPKLSGNKYALGYFNYLKEQLIEGSVKCPRDFSGLNSERATQNEILKVVPEEITIILEEEFGKTSIEAIHRAFDNKTKNWKSNESVNLEAQYMIHIWKFVGIKEEVKNPQQYCTTEFNAENKNEFQKIGESSNARAIRNATTKKRKTTKN